MLNSEITKKIEDFVYSKPRSIQEIAQHIEKNWRTVDRYVGEIEKNFGTIAIKVFRGGTRGALKIVYWASVEKLSHSVFQERLEADIFRARRKEEFSTFDIFQFVSKDKKKVSVLNNELENMKEFEEILLSVNKQLLIFSGNLSFLNLKDKKRDLFDVLEEVVRRGANVKIISRVDLAGMENVKKALSLNFKFGKELIAIRHDEHPLRGVIIDNNVVRLKEVKEPTGKINELNKKVFIYYTLKEKEWIEWLTKIFWKKFSNSIDANRRLEELRKLKVN